MAAVGKIVFCQSNSMQVNWNTWERTSHQRSEEVCDPSSFSILLLPLKRHAPAVK